MSFRIVTDSSCDLPLGVAESLGLRVIPCNVHFGEEVLRDGVDIQQEEFYRRLATGDVHPTTSQPSIGAFLELYEALAKETDQILSLHISSKLSGTINSATQAKRELNGQARIEIFDSSTVSLGLGLLARECGRIARDGGSLDDTLAFLTEEAPNIRAFFTVETLEYLVRGGRASRLQGFFGTLLGIKPIIELRDGETHPVDRVRTRKRAVARLRDIVHGYTDIRSLGFMHSRCEADAEALAQESPVPYPSEKVMLSELSPVMGAHLGPGALGVVVWSRG